jgi:hypothetical protein
MELLKRFPLSEREFMSWFENHYKLYKDIFEKAPFDRQCEAIWRYLGYPVDVPPGWSLQKVEDHTKNILYIYEQLLIKYPGGPPDVLKNLKEMNYQEREIKYPDMDKPANILHSLNEAIIKRGKYEIIVSPVLQSLRDAIIDLRQIIICRPLNIDEPFWEEVKNNKRIKENVPF